MRTLVQIAENVGCSHNGHYVVSNGFEWVVVLDMFTDQLIHKVVWMAIVAENGGTCPSGIAPRCGPVVGRVLEVEIDVAQ
jgi:hypothetical protein